MVVQGRADGDLRDVGHPVRRCVDSVRRVLPGAELVLSTWKGASTTGLDVDVVVLNDDPGPVAPRISWGPPNNVNRQVVSTRAGLEAAQRPMALKLRVDMELVHDGALRLFGGWPDRSAECKVLTDRILVPTAYSFNPRRLYRRFPYMICDWSHFGRTDDLIDVWSTPHWDTSLEWMLGRRVVAVEQFIWMSLLNRHDQDAAYDRPNRVEHSELSIANNVVLLEAEDLGVRFDKFEVAAPHVAGCYTHDEWQRLYDRWCRGRPRWGVDRQSAFRTVLDRAWIRGVGSLVYGPPDDVAPVPRVAPPALTPNRPEVVRPST